MAVQMLVNGISVDARNNAPVVVLREVEGARAVPIWIGQLEANSIALALSGKKPPRPQTHDLLKSAINGAGFHVVRADIVDLRDGTFFASVELARGGEHVSLDSRPSDAIALALRARAPIFVDEAVLAVAAVKVEDEERDRWEALLQTLTEEDFGKYKQ